MSVGGQNWMRCFSYIVLYILRNFLQKYGRSSLKLPVCNSDKCHVCHESGGWSLVFHSRGTGSIPDQSMCELRWEKRNIGKYFSVRTSVFPCQYHSTIAPYSFIYLPPRLYNVFLPALQFPPVSIIPPLLRTHLQPHFAVCRNQTSGSLEPCKKQRFSRKTLLQGVGWFVSYFVSYIFNYLFKDVIAACSSIHTKYINTLRGQNFEFVNFKPVVQTVVTASNALTLFHLVQEAYFRRLAMTCWPSNGQFILTLSLLRYVIVHRTLYAHTVH